MPKDPWEKPLYHDYDDKDAAPVPRPQRKVVCPRCGSSQIQASKQGYNYGCGCLGLLLTGPFGLLLGGLGANMTELICLNCGKRWMPRYRPPKRGKRKESAVEAVIKWILLALLILAILFVAIVVMMPV